VQGQKPFDLAWKRRETMEATLPANCSVETAPLQASKKGTPKFRWMLIDPNGYLIEERVGLRCVDRFYGGFNEYISNDVMTTKMDALERLYN
jgi:hypothetical protein